MALTIPFAAHTLQDQPVAIDRNKEELQIDAHGLEKDPWSPRGHSTSIRIAGVEILLRW